MLRLIITEQRSFVNEKKPMSNSSPTYRGGGILTYVMLKCLAITSDGISYPNHKCLQKSKKKFARLQRQLSRKAKESKNAGRHRRAKCKATSTTHPPRRVGL